MDECAIERRLRQVEREIVALALGQENIRRLPRDDLDGAIEQQIAAYGGEAGEQPSPE